MTRGAECRTYAGIGSRSTPAHILTVMEQVAGELHRQGWWLYTGGADGADCAFYRGARQAGCSLSVFLPWNGFNGFHDTDDGVHCGVDDDAMEIAATVHPAWGQLSAAARRLHARNCYQILGPALATPVRFVLCWTPDGAQTESETSTKTGGTGQAIRLASRHGVPVFNLARAESLERVSRRLGVRM